MRRRLASIRARCAALHAVLIVAIVGRRSARRERRAGTDERASAPRPSHRWMCFVYANGGSARAR
jgi:hypothetical protein